MNSTTETPVLSPVKELRHVATHGFIDSFSDNETIFQLCLLLGHKLFLKFKLDMFVFEDNSETGFFQVRAAGYKLGEDSELDETTILHQFGLKMQKAGFKPGFKFWFKVDDYGDFFLGTFLLPEEY